MFIWSITMHLLCYRETTQLFSCRKYPISAAISTIVCLFNPRYLEDLAKPGVEVVCVGRHSSFQIWRLEGDVLEGQGRRDCVENLEKKS